MTIYRLYASNGNRAGFWVQHRSWSNVCAQVQSIDGHTVGVLPGAAALYDNARVLMRLFDIRSGRPMPANPSHAQPEDKNYVQIATPYWSGSADEAEAELPTA